MKIRIERCSDPTNWYASHIGTVVAVEWIDSYGYWTRDTGPMRCSQWVKCEDAVIVEHDGAARPLDPAEAAVLDAAIVLINRGDIGLARRVLTGPAADLATDLRAYIAANKR